MLIHIRRTMILLLLISATAAFAQEQKKKPQSISTEPKLLVVELKTDDGKTVKISGEAIFKVEAANSDDTMTGMLTYTISGDSRQEIARVMNKPLQGIPERITVNDVVVGFVKNTGCPDLDVEFLAREVKIAGAKAYFDQARLTFQESSQDLSKLLCSWARRINNGRGHTPIRAINRLLAGEEMD